MQPMRLMSITSRNLFERDCMTTRSYAYKGRRFLLYPTIKKYFYQIKDARFNWIFLIMSLKDRLDLHSYIGLLVARVDRS